MSVKYRVYTAQWKTECQFCHESIACGQQLRWVQELRQTFHVTCPPVYTKISAEHASVDIESFPVKTRIAHASVLPQLATLFDGRFAVPYTTQSGEKGHCVVRVLTRKFGTYKGSKVLSVHIGRHDEKEFIRAAYITTAGTFAYYADFLHSKTSELVGERKRIAIAALELVASGKENEPFALSYATIAKKCWRCGRSLYHPKTLASLPVKYGTGPNCWKHIENNAQLLERIEAKHAPTIIFT